MHRAIIVAMFVRFALAQSVTLPERLPKAVRDFGPGAARGELPCAVEVLPPVLNFVSRFQAGYVVRAPMNAYPAPFIFAAISGRPSSRRRRPADAPRKSDCGSSRRRMIGTEA
jgi:hypothetical protein